MKRTAKYNWFWSGWWTIPDRKVDIIASMYNFGLHTVDSWKC